MDKHSYSRTSKDAELILLCRQFVALEEARQRIYDDTCFNGQDEDFLERAFRPFDDKQEAIIQRVRALPTHTASGMVARVQAFAVLRKVSGDTYDTGTYDDMMLGPILNHAGHIPFDQEGAVS